jgi:putative membrane protein insertion efficiency factor
MLDSSSTAGATPTPASNARGEVAAPPVNSLPARAAGGLVWLYQQTLSPALAVLHPTGGCRFAPTCSHYARGALQEHGLLVGSWLTLRRLAKCGPWHPGGEDPVPTRKFSCVRIRPATPAKG